MLRTILLGLTLAVMSCQKTAPPPEPPKSDHLIMATLFQQSAAEYRALCYQAFNVARLRLDDALKKRPVKKPAVIVDVDETVLDNSYYEAQLILDNKSYTFDSWKQWTDKSTATPLPGALEFLTYAASKGVEVFYITNRRDIERNSTVANLRNHGFPHADTAHVIPKTDDSDKEPRRLAIAGTHEILLLCGDNLNDLSQIFYHKDAVLRSAAADSQQHEFGRRFIVLPNAMYGDWEGAVFNYERGLSDSAKMSLRKRALRGY